MSTVIVKSFWERYGFIIGSLFSALGLALAVYPIVHEAKPVISFDVVSEANVLDLHSPPKDLIVSFKGEDVQASNLNLRIFTLKVTNSGDADILTNYYDVDDTWGLEVKDGNVVEARLIGSNSDYLQSKMNPELVSPSLIKLKKTIFEKGKFFTLEILVLHDKDVPPRLLPLGKIAGVETIRIFNNSLEDKKESFLAAVIHGDPIVHVARFFIYFFVFIGTIGLIASLGGYISDVREKRLEQKRRELIAPLMFRLPVEGATQRKLALELYVKAGDEMLDLCKAIDRNDERAIKQIKMHGTRYGVENRVIKTTISHNENLKELSVDDSNEEFLPFRFINPLIEELLDKDAVKRSEDGTFSLNEEFKSALKELGSFLESTRFQLK